MSNLILNVRFGAYHLQIVRLSSWRGEAAMGRSPITISRNGYHAKGSPARSAPGWRFVEWY